MLAAGGLLILIALGVAFGGMIDDDSADTAAEGDDPTPAEDVEATASSAGSVPMLEDILFGSDTEDTDTDPANDGDTPGAATSDSASVADYPGDRLFLGGTEADVMHAREAFQTLLPDQGDDAVTGGPDADTITGDAGPDALFGNEGDDHILGSDGEDELYGDEGDDSLFGGAGADFLVGGDGHDGLFGDAGDDLLFGGDGDDLMDGGDGDDYLQGGFGIDTLLGGAGNDVLDGTFTSGASVFATGDQDQGDILDGGDGDDTILIGAGDVASGGAGHDSFLSGGFIGPESMPGQITDFDPQQDMIELIYDPITMPDPVVTVVDFADGTGAEILLNGVVILTVSGAQGLDPAAIELRMVEIDQMAQSA